MTTISCQPKYALFIKKKSHTEVNIRNGIDAYNKIRKIQGSFYSKENKKWYVPNSGVATLIDYFNEMDIQSYLDEHYTEKVPFCDKTNNYNTSNFNEEQLGRSVKLAFVSGNEIRVNLPIARSIFGKIAPLAHTRDWDLNQLVIQEDKIKEFYTACEENNIKIL